MNGRIRTREVPGTEVGLPTKVNTWSTVSTEFLGFPPSDFGPVPKHIMHSIWSFDPAAVPLWIRRTYRTHDSKFSIRVFNGLGFQSFLPSSQGKEQINVFRPVGKYKFNGPIYEDQVFEWYPSNFNRRDLPGVFLPWDECRLTELRAAHWRLYGRHNGAVKTDAEINGLFPTREERLKDVLQDGKDRLQDVAGPIQNPFVGYTGREYSGN